MASRRSMTARPSRPAEQRRRRLVADDVEREAARIPLGHVRRVGDDEVGRHPQAAGEIRLDEVNPVADLMALRIRRARRAAPRARCRWRRPRRRGRSCGQRDRQAAGAGADVDDCRRRGRAGSAALPRRSARFRAAAPGCRGVTAKSRPQNSRRAGDHRDRLAPRPAIDEGLIPLVEAGGRGVAVVRRAAARGPSRGRAGRAPRRRARRPRRRYPPPRAAAAPRRCAGAGSSPEAIAGCDERMRSACGRQWVASPSVDSFSFCD